MASPDPKQPLSETTFYILLSLSGAPRHGYAIMQNVLELSDGRVKLSTGTLYGAIKRMLESGWIRRVEEPEEPVTDRRDRKSYELTRLGKKLLEAEIQRLGHMVRAVQAVKDGARL